MRSFICSVLLSGEPTADAGLFSSIVETVAQDKQARR
jgi:hypothetical protein